jgi:PAS domain S-box-containing protein
MRQAIREKMVDLAENNRRLQAEIAQRREAEQERDRLVSILEATTDIVSMTDPTGKLLYFNRAGRSTFGIEPGATLEGFFPRVHPRWASDIVTEEGVPAAVRDGVWSGETAVLALDGTEIPVSQVILSHKDAQGRLLFLSTIMRDITERKRTETALRIKDDAIAASINGIAFADLSGGLSYVNRAFLRMWGYNREDQVVGRSALEFWVDPEEAAGILGILTTRDDWSGELTARRQDGSPFVVLLSAVVIRDTSGQPVQLMGSFVDITERKQAEEALRQLTAELEARVHERTAELETANRELEAFSYSVSHDLRAPLRAIDGFSRVLMEDYAASLDAEGYDYLDRVRKAVQRMGHLIDDLLQLARVSRAEMHPASVDLTQLAPEIVAELRETAPTRKVEVSIAPGLSARGDPRLLQVVLANLIGNAWKYTGKTDNPRIELGAVRQNGEIVYYVRDNGVGFDMKYAGKLFGAFQRMHSEREFPGTGVGLATVARIIHRHGGRVWAESEPGKGATFFFTVARSKRPRTDERDLPVRSTADADSA